MAFEMPSDATIAAYCHSHYPAKVLKPIIKQAAEACPAPVQNIGAHMPSQLSWTLVGYIVAGLVGYEICKYGISTIYTNLRNYFSAAKTVTVPTTSTPVVTASTTTPVV